MNTFEYEARNQDGEPVAGTILANDRDHAGRLLGERDLFVVRIGEAATRSRRKATLGHATRTQVAWLMWQLSVLMETGMQLSEALSCLARQSSHPRLRALLEQIDRELHDGRSLSEAMEKFPRSFPTSLVAMVRASEMSGTLGAVLRKSSTYLIQDRVAVRRLRSAMMYPAFMMIICGGIGAFLVTVILPKFEAVFSTRGAALPGPTRFLMAAGDSLLSHWYAYAIGAMVVVLGIGLALRTTEGRRYRDYLVVSVPGVSHLFNSLYQCRAFRTMALLLETSVPLLDALKLLQSIVPNALYCELWADVQEQVEVGERVAGPLLTSDLIPESLAQVIDNGDRAGRLPMAFEQLARYTEEEYDRRLTTAMQFVEPAMILLMGGIVAFVAVALMLPLIRVSQVVTG